MATNYDINYNDKRFTEVESDKKAALNDVDVTYGNMISQSDKYYDKQIQASKDWADKQSQLQQEKTDFAIEKIEQEKAQAKKDYTKEQSGAYVDWQKQSNQYGANAEEVAAGGMTNTGFAESSQVSMYNTYQNRVATARESYNLAVQNYNNSITEARLQNNSVLAEIAYEALQQQLELSLQGFQYKNQLLIEQSNKKMALESEYHQRYQDVLKQINTENALAEEVRQYNEKMAEEIRQFDILHPKDTGGTGGGGGKITKYSGKKNKTSGNSNNTIKRVSAGERDQNNSSGTKIDTKSVIAAGLGPASGDTIAQAVADGNVKAVQNGDTIYIKKNLSGGSGGVGKNLLFRKTVFE